MEVGNVWGCSASRGATAFEIFDEVSGQLKQLRASLAFQG